MLSARRAKLYERIKKREEEEKTKVEELQKK